MSQGDIGLCIVAVLVCRLFPDGQPLDVDVEALMPTFPVLGSSQQAKHQHSTAQSEHFQAQSDPPNAASYCSAAVADQLVTLLEQHLNEHSKWDIWADEEDELMTEEAELQVACLASYFVLIWLSAVWYNAKCLRGLP